MDSTISIFFFTLVTAHLIGDFCMQFDWVLRFKQKYLSGIALHVLIHLIVTAALLETPTEHIPLFVILGCSHFAIDWIKLRGSVRNKFRDFWLDQLAHVLVIAIIVLVVPTASPALSLHSTQWLGTIVFWATLLSLFAIFRPRLPMLPADMPFQKVFLFAQGMGSGALVTLRLASLML